MLNTEIVKALPTNPGLPYLISPGWFSVFSNSVSCMRCSNYSPRRRRGATWFTCLTNRKTRRSRLDCPSRLPCSRVVDRPLRRRRLPVTRLRITACLIISAVMQSKYVQRRENWRCANYRIKTQKDEFTSKGRRGRRWKKKEEDERVRVVA